MERELETMEEQMKNEIKSIKEKYATIKKEIRNKYKSEKPKNSRVSIPKAVKDTIWDQSFGKEAGIGKCYCCTGEINSKKFDCGHIISVANSGTNNIDNLKPICSTCNKSMGTANMEEFKMDYFSKMEKCRSCKDSVIECDMKYKEINEKSRGPKSVGIRNDMRMNTVCNGCITRNLPTNDCGHCHKPIVECDGQTDFMGSANCIGRISRVLNVGMNRTRPMPSYF